MNGVKKKRAKEERYLAFCHENIYASGVMHIKSHWCVLVYDSPSSSIIYLVWRFLTELDTKREGAIVADKIS